jgi:hypothetical protein
MNNFEDRSDTVIDYVTGEILPDMGAEKQRQQMERFLVLEKGYEKSDIAVNWPLAVAIDGETYLSRIDLLICIGEDPLMAVKCAAGSLDSREREIISAARLVSTGQVPLSVSTDGRTAIVWDTITGKKIGEGLDALPGRMEAIRRLASGAPVPLPVERQRREAIIFRSYDSMNVNVNRES